MTILISLYTVNCSGHNGHLRDELYATLEKEGKDDDKVSPSYFSRTIHWPIPLCNVGQLCSKQFNHDLQSSFTIQGLWPFNATGQMLEYCHTTKVLTNSKV